jgi:hypothetical protein
VHKSQLVYALPFLAFAEKVSLKENLRSNIYIARLSCFFCVPASHVLSDIYVNHIKVEWEKKLGNTAIRRTNKTLCGEVREKKVWRYREGGLGIYKA